MQITLMPARPEDAKAIWDMQVRAFQPLLARYQDYDTNPAAETVDRALTRITMENSYCHWICSDGARCGMIRVLRLSEGVYRVGPLFVDARYQNRGIAQAAMRLAEEMYPAKRWQLDTILEEKGNCHLYEKLGYRKTGALRRVNDKMTLVDYEKEGNEGTSVDTV